MLPISFKYYLDKDPKSIIKAFRIKAAQVGAIVIFLLLSSKFYNKSYKFVIIDIYKYFFAQIYFIDSL